eukprot:1160311-Pelagomonas_calceolata.AAC.6
MEWGCKRMQATDDPAEPDNGNQLTLIWHKHTHTLSLCGFAMRTEVVDVIRTANREGKLNTWVSIQYATPERGQGKPGKQLRPLPAMFYLYIIQACMQPSLQCVSLCRWKAPHEHLGCIILAIITSAMRHSCRKQRKPFSCTTQSSWDAPSLWTRQLRQSMLASWLCEHPVSTFSLPLPNRRSTSSRWKLMGSICLLHLLVGIWGAKRGATTEQQAPDLIKQKPLPGLLCVESASQLLLPANQYILKTPCALQSHRAQASSPWRSRGRLLVLPRLLICGHLFGG